MAFNYQVIGDTSILQHNRPETSGKITNRHANDWFHSRGRWRGNACTVTPFHPRGWLLDFYFFLWPLSHPVSPPHPSEKASVGGLSPGRATAAPWTDSYTPNYPQASCRANAEWLKQTVIHWCASSKALQTEALHQSVETFLSISLKNRIQTEEWGLWLVNLKIYFHIKRHYENIRWLLYTVLCIKRT